MQSPLIDRLAGIVQDPKASPREATSAAKAILSASRLNLEAITATIKAQKHRELVKSVVDIEARIEAQRSNRQHEGRRF
jgi:hypothetical protein